MRHGNHRSKLNRTSEHRLALMRNLSVALITNERIRTTEVKAKQLRPFVEPLISRARKDDLTSRRLVNSRLQNRAASIKLFEDIGPRVAGRDGGYLRIVKDGPRMGDGAPMAFIEFVDPRPKKEEDAPKRPKSLKQRIHQKKKEMKAAR